MMPQGQDGGERKWKGRTQNVELEVHWKGQKRGGKKGWAGIQRCSRFLSLFYL